MSFTPNTIQSLIAYAAYLGTALLFIAVFLIIYTKVTRYNEWELMRQGNLAAVLSLGGAVLGFSFTLFISMIRQTSWEKFVLWSVLAMAIQVLLYLLISIFVLKGYNQAIQSDNVAKGLFMGILSISIGLVNAASLF